MLETDNSILSAAFSHMRNQRHEFMNYLQVLYGYLQIGQDQNALEYLKKVNSRLLMEGQLFTMEDKMLYLAISEFITSCYHYGVEIELYEQFQYISCSINRENINNTIKAFSTVSEMLDDYFMNAGDRNPLAFIRLFSREGHIIFMAATSKECMDKERDGEQKLTWKVHDNVKTANYNGDMLLQIPLT